MTDKTFLPGRTYENVYLIVVDASGYSNIVRQNPRDQSARAFDLLRERVITRASTVSAELRCARTQLWTWRGDGGFLAVHDENESVARDVALITARDILRLDLTHVRQELRHTELNGELHLRIAVHKGTISHAANGHTGAIHSPDINFAAHLEEATPPDCVAISEDVYQAAGRHASAFEYVGTYDRRNIYLMTMAGMPSEARTNWLAGAGLAGSARVFALPQRPSQKEKARLVGAAHNEIIDLGTALRTSAHCLVTTERPAYLREAVLDFLRRGGIYRCVLLDPLCDTTSTLSEYRHEDLPAKIRGSIVDFGRFKQRHGAVTDGLHVYQSRAFPGFAAIAVNLDTPDAMILYSPYLMTMKSLDLHVDRGDSPHYLATTTSGPLLANLASLIKSSTAPDTLERIL